jgi:hypothetical protein
MGDAVNGVRLSFANGCRHRSWSARGTNECNCSRSRRGAGLFKKVLPPDTTYFKATAGPAAQHALQAKGATVKRQRRTLPNVGVRHASN